MYFTSVIFVGFVSVLWTIVGFCHYIICSSIYGLDDQPFGIF